MGQVTIEIDKSLFKKKKEILVFFRGKAEESLKVVCAQFSKKDFKERANAVNSAVNLSRAEMLQSLVGIAKKDKWDREVLLKTILLITYCSNVVMLEARNDVWAYEYMTFSRRIGELWEPFCALCWLFPIIPDLKLFNPPSFDLVKKRLNNNIEEYIDELGITPDQKLKLKSYYGEVWDLVSSGEIQLELDLHFELKGKKYVADLKSGFSSNEKGNTNRLLLVASIYKNFEPNCECLILVRSDECENNHYLQTLKKSGLWKVSCGVETYNEIKKLTGFDLRNWINANFDWENDFKKETFKHLKDNNLVQYLKW